MNNSDVLWDKHYCFGCSACHCQLVPNIVMAPRTLYFQFPLSSRKCYLYGLHISMSFSPLKFGFFLMQLYTNKSIETINVLNNCSFLSCYSKIYFRNRKKKSFIGLFLIPINKASKIWYFLFLISSSKCIWFNIYKSLSNLKIVLLVLLKYLMKYLIHLLLNHPEFHHIWNKYCPSKPNYSLFVWSMRKGIRKK